MSQSDYIKYKKVSTKLRIDNNTAKQPRVFDQGNYLDFKEYTLENTIVNTKPVFDRVTLNGQQVVFDMYKTVTGCPTFIDCSNTNLRTNRVPMSTVYYTPTPQRLTWEQKKNASYLKTACVCQLNRSYTGYNACKCKRAH